MKRERERESEMDREKTLGRKQFWHNKERKVDI